MSDAEILELARMAMTIEDHYGLPMDIEWARDGDTGELFIVQARPETVQSRSDTGAIQSYSVKKAGKVLLKGLSVGSAFDGRDGSHGSDCRAESDAAAEFLS